MYGAGHAPLVSSIACGGRRQWSEAYDARLRAVADTSFRTTVQENGRHLGVLESIAPKALVLLLKGGASADGTSVDAALKALSISALDVCGASGSDHVSVGKAEAIMADVLRAWAVGTEVLGLRVKQDLKEQLAALKEGFTTTWTVRAPADLGDRNMLRFQEEGWALTDRMQSNMRVATLASAVESYDPELTTAKSHRLPQGFMLRVPTPTSTLWHPFQAASVRHLLGLVVRQERRAGGPSADAERAVFRADCVDRVLSSPPFDGTGKQRLIACTGTSTVFLEEVSSGASRPHGDGVEEMCRKDEPGVGVDMGWMPLLQYIMCASSSWHQYPALQSALCVAAARNGEPLVGPCATWGTGMDLLDAVLTEMLSETAQSASETARTAASDADYTPYAWQFLQAWEENMRAGMTALVGVLNFEQWMVFVSGGISNFHGEPGRLQVFVNLTRVLKLELCRWATLGSMYTARSMLAAERAAAEA